MSSTILFRLSGLSLLLGGLLAVVSLIHPNASSGLEYLSDPRTVPAHLLGLTAVLLIMLGLPGLYAGQAERAGVLGLVGTVAVFFCVALLDGTHNVIDSMVRPALATLPEAAPLLTEGGPLDSAMEAGPLGTIVAVAGPVFLLGMIVLGIATIRARVLPRWVGTLPIVAALFVPLGFVVPSLEGIAFAMPYVALGGLGLALMVQRPAAITGPAAPRSAEPTRRDASPERSEVR